MSRCPGVVAQTSDWQQPDPALLKHVVDAFDRGAVPLARLRTRMLPTSAR